MVQAPIFHVNGDDPEACVRAARLAFGFRQAFHKDVVIDMVCYRRHGHNEGDDPSYTQPLMYALIDAKRSVRKLYTESLVRRGDISLEEAEQALDDFSARLQAALDETRAEAETADGPVPVAARVTSCPTSMSRPVPTGIDATVLSNGWPTAVRTVPEGFVIHPKLARQFEQRDKVVADGEIDWALGEALALGSLLVEGTNVRLTGQDTRRGTFSQRHAVLVDNTNGRGVRAAGRTRGRAVHHPRLPPVRVRLCRASSTATRSRPSTTWWPGRPSSATSGTAPKIIVDNFLVAAEDKWGQKSGLVLLLPHGYEGQGPEHSSARHRAVPDPVRPGQPAGHRAHHRGPVLPPAALPGPGSRPHAPHRASPPSRCSGPARPGRRSTAFTRASFAEVLDDPAAGREDSDPAAGATGWCCAPARWPTTPWPGGTSWATAGRTVAVVRVEQLYPWPKSAIRRGARPVPAAPRRWCGCRRSPRTWGRGTSSTAGCTSLLRGDPHPAPREPGRVGQPGLGQRRPPPARAGRPAGPRRRLAGVAGARPARLSGQEVVGQGDPHLGGQVERLDVHPLVDPVEHGPVLLEADGRGCAGRIRRPRCRALGGTSRRWPRRVRKGTVRAPG